MLAAKSFPETASFFCLGSHFTQRWPPCELNIFCTSTTAESRTKIWYQWNAFKPPPPPPPPWLRLLSVLRRWFCCCWLFVYCNSLCGSLWLFYLLLYVNYVHSIIAIILMGKRELVALLNLSSWCLVTVERLFLAVPWGCLWLVIVVFPDHTHLLFLVESLHWCCKK